MRPRHPHEVDGNHGGTETQRHAGALASSHLNREGAKEKNGIAYFLSSSRLRAFAVNLFD